MVYLRLPISFCYIIHQTKISAFLRKNEKLILCFCWINSHFDPWQHAPQCHAPFSNQHMLRRRRPRSTYGNGSSHLVGYNTSSLVSGLSLLVKKNNGYTLLRRWDEPPSIYVCMYNHVYMHVTYTWYGKPDNHLPCEHGWVFAILGLVNSWLEGHPEVDIEISKTSQ